MIQTLRATFKSAGAAWLLAAAAAVPWPAQAQAQSLTVATDSSLIDAMKLVAHDFEAAHAGVSIKLLPGAAGALLGQIAQSTAVDVLAGADAETVDQGVQRRLLVPDLRSVFAINTLVLVVPASLNLPVQRLSDLGRLEVARIAMGRESSEPAGRYAREAINAQRLWPSVQRKVVVTDDVRDALALVVGADVEAGFVYTTDVAAAAGRVRVVETLNTTTPIRYLANVVADSKHAALARDFVSHLRSDPARAVFKQFGFGLP